MNGMIHCATEERRSQIKFRFRDQTTWPTQLKMVVLFDATKQKISLHPKNLLAEGALESTATTKESLTAQIKHGRKIQRPVNLYNLDAILAVGDQVLCPVARPV